MIKVLMLTNGDKVIGNIEEDGEEFIRIKEPFILREIFTKEGPQLLPMPLLPTAEKSIVIWKDAIAVKPCEPLKNLNDDYVQMTSNIVIANPNVNVNNLKMQ